VEALARAGRLDEARLAFEKMLTYASHVGLYSEEIGLTGEAARQLPPGLHAPSADQRRLQPGPLARVSASELVLLVPPASGSFSATGRHVRASAR
jgi:hypothetical protein